MVKLLDDYQHDAKLFQQAGITVPEFDQSVMTEETMESPIWLHFGGGNLFRCFHSSVVQQLLNKGDMESGVIVAETYDREVIDKVVKGGLRLCCFC